MAKSKRKQQTGRSVLEKRRAKKQKQAENLERRARAELTRGAV